MFLFFAEIIDLSILIADSGSTKADWIFTGSESEIRFRTTGFNPYFYTATRFAKALSREVIPQLAGNSPGKIFFYGAGCAADDRKAMVHDAMSSVFEGAVLEVHDDLLGAARGLLKQQTGFIAILGTGMNNGWFNGDRMLKQVDSLGFILGDEGSGTAIGRQIIRAYLRNEMPDQLLEAFKNKYRLQRDDIIRAVYSGNEVNRFIAGFTRFAAEQKQEPYLQNLVMEVFREFFDKIVSKYPERKGATFNAVGSVAFHFSELLSAAVAESGMTLGAIEQSPMEGLLAFHNK